MEYGQVVRGKEVGGDRAGEEGLFGDGEIILALRSD